jgi:hypothetical protein
LPHSSALLRVPLGLAPCWLVSLTGACKFAKLAVVLPRPSRRARDPPVQWLLRASCLAGHSPPFLYLRAPIPARCPARYPSSSSPRVLAASCVSAAPCACAARRRSPRSRLPCPSHVLLRSLPLSQRRVRVWGRRGAPPLQGVCRACCACAARHLASCTCFCLPHRRCCQPLPLVLPPRLCFQPLLLVLPPILRVSHFVAAPHVRACVRLPRVGLSAGPSQVLVAVGAWVVRPRWLRCGCRRALRPQRVRVGVCQERTRLCGARGGTTPRDATKVTRLALIACKCAVH